MSAFGVYSFHFQGMENGLIDLFAVGRQDVRDPAYRWEGMGRGDGPVRLFQYTLAGAGVLEQDGRSWWLGPGTGFFVDIPSEHVYRIAPGEPRWELLFILLRPNGTALWDASVDRLGTVAPIASTEAPIRALTDLIQSASAGQITDRHTASLLSYRFLVELHRYAHRPMVSTPPEAVVRAIALLDSGWNRPWKLPEVAKQVGLSTSHFHRLFRQHTGLSPLEWLTRRRVEKAVELLGNHTVDATARALGFADTGYFIRVFRRWVGVTPGMLKQSPSAWAGSKIVLSKSESSDVQSGKIPLA